MKKLLSILLITTLIFTSCKNNESKEGEESTDKTTITDESVVSADTEEAKNCDEFIDNYEAWMETYVDFLGKYLKNPLDAAISEEYIKLSQESMTWTQQWTGNLYMCATQEKYQKRFEEISEKAEKKLKEMGLE